MRAELQRANQHALVLASPGITSLQMRLDACLEEMSRMAGRVLPKIVETALRCLVDHSNQHLARISEAFRDQ